MPPYYEEAAQLLRFMAAAGLIIPADWPLYRTLSHLAGIIRYIHEVRPTHAVAAELILDDMSRAGLAIWDADRKSRILAVAGTSIGNLLTMTDVARRQGSQR